MTEFMAARADVQALTRYGRRTQYDERNRLWLLAAHALWGITIGACFLVFGVPIGWRIALSESPSVQGAIAAAPIAGGLVLAAGLLLRRALALEAAGMTVLLTWELAGVYVVLRWIHLANPGPLQYQVAFYGLPATLMVIHLVTLVAYLRAPQPSGSSRV